MLLLSQVPAREPRGSYQEKGSLYMVGARGDQLDAGSLDRLCLLPRVGEAVLD